jgi:NADH-quinone oxidoreductase subunit A
MVASQGLRSAFAAGLVTAIVVGALAGTAVAFGHRRGRFGSTAPQRVPVLGGFEPATHAWSRFHVRFYSMTLVFIAFEMEMMFMYPWAVVYVEEGVKALTEMAMFLAILSVGITYAHREGVFRWQ